MSITEIVTLALKVLTFIVVVFIIPLIKKKYDKDHLEGINNKIMTYVRAAEQIFGSDEGTIKKAWVKERLAAWGIDLDLEYFDAQVEEAVLLLHNALRE